MNSLSIELRWGAIIGIAGFIWLYIEFALGFHGERIMYHPIFTNAFYPFAFVMYFIAIRQKRESIFKGSLNFWDGIKTGTIIALIVAVIAPVGQYFFHVFLGSDFFINAREYSKQIYIENGSTEEEAIEAAKIYFNLRNYMWGSSFDAVFAGGLSSLICSAILSRKPK